MHLLQAVSPECDQSVVTVDAEIREVLQQPISKLLIPCGTRTPCLGQHGVVGPVVANPLLTEHVLVGRAGRVSSSPLLPRKLAFGVWQLKKHCSCRERPSLSGAVGKHLQLALVVLPLQAWAGARAPTHNHSASPVTWIYCGLFSAGKLKAEAEYLSCTNPNLW